MANCQQVGCRPEQGQARQAQKRGVGYGDRKCDEPLGQGAVAGPDHFPVYVSIDTVVENATGSDHQGYADESRRESNAINPPFGGQKKAGCRGDQVAENDPRFGNEHIVFDPGQACSHHSVIQGIHDPEGAADEEGHDQ